jgi:hypothetical protein
MALKKGIKRCRIHCHMFNKGAITNHPIRIYSANFLQCMNVNNECFIEIIYEKKLFEVKYKIL